MKLVSWNVNGLRACVKKAFDFFKEINADILLFKRLKCKKIKKSLM